MKKLQIIIFLAALLLLSSSFVLNTDFFASFLTRDGNISHTIYLILIVLFRIFLFLSAVFFIVLAFWNNLCLKIIFDLKKNWLNCLLLCCSIFIGLILLEGVLYVLHGEKFNNRNMEEKVYINLEYNMSIKLNSDGFRDNEFNSFKAPNAFRIFIVGDSFPFGAGVEENETFPTLLEKQLAGEFPDKKIEVYNFGLPGRGPYAYLHVLKRYIKKYNPNLVVAAFYLGNDIMKGSLFFENIRFLTFPNLRQFFRKNILEVDSLKDEAFLLSKAEQKYKDYAQQGLINQAMLLQSYYFSNTSAYYKTLATNFNSNSYIKEILLNLNALSKEIGAKFMLITIPDGTRISIKSRKAQEKLGFLYDNDFINASDKLQEDINAFADSKGIYVLNLLRYLEGYSEEVYYPFDRHWNPTGHKLVANALYTKIDPIIKNE